MRVVSYLSALICAFGLGEISAGDELAGLPLAVTGGITTVIFTLLREDWI